MLQIIQTRIISVTSWYHLAFLVISIAMFGLTAGAVWVYLRHATFAPAWLSYHLAVATLGAALATAAGLIVQTTLAVGLSSSLTGFMVWTEFALCLAAPFFFSGIVVSLALTRSPYPIGKTYGADLLGAAAGCLGVLLVLEATTGPSAVLWIAVALAAAALVFAGPGSAPPEASPLAAGLFRHRQAVLVTLLLVAAANDLTGHGVRPLLVKSRWESGSGAFAFEGWNSYSRITAGRSREDIPQLWGASPRMPAFRTGQRFMTIDGLAGTTMFRFGGDFADLDFLRYDVTNLAYNIPGLRTGAVIGVGGGRDVLSARLHGVHEVVGVELNPIFIDLLTRRFADFNAAARAPGVSFAVDEARSWFARSSKSFDVIQMSLIDTWAATGAGAFTLSENGLYTIEAWRIFLKRLSPNGVFTVSRWHAAGEANETGRMVSLAVAALLEEGATAPERHVFVATAGRVATLVLGRAPFTPTALAALEQAAADKGFTVLISPSRSAASPLLQRIVTATSRETLDAATADSGLDLSPPTDSRPFFFNQLRFDRLLDWSDWPREGVVHGNLQATMTLGMLVLISAGLVLVTIMVPLRATVRGVGRALVGGGTLYFLLIGVGFMMTEIALLQRMSVFLGHPVYALSVVLFSLILATGLGSLVSERLRLDTLPRLGGWAAATAFYLWALPAWMPGALLEFDAANLLVRAGFCVLVLAPAGFLMGFFFPTGMRLAARIDTGPTPWFWGINGAAGVLAASLAVLTSLAFGIDTTLRVGALCYLLLPAPALLLLYRRKPGVGHLAAGRASAS
jgi:hypothetical protein